jgi:hypothetical protein
MASYPGENNDFPFTDWTPNAITNDLTIPAGNCGIAGCDNTILYRAVNAGNYVFGRNVPPVGTDLVIIRDR